MDGESTVVDVFRWSRCKRPLTQKVMQSIGIPLPLEHVEVIFSRLFLSFLYQVVLFLSAKCYATCYYFVKIGSSAFQYATCNNFKVLDSLVLLILILYRFFIYVLICITSHTIHIRVHVFYEGTLIMLLKFI